MEWYVNEDKRDDGLDYSLCQIVPIVPVALVKRAGAREEEGIYFIYYTSPSATNKPQLNPGSQSY